MARFVALLIVLVALPACGEAGDPLGLPTRAPDLSGEITSIDRAGRIRVIEVRPDADVGSPDPCGVWLDLREATVVDVDVQVEPAAIEPRRRVDVWIDGPVAESCPAQGTAEAVELLPR